MKPIFALSMLSFAACATNPLDPGAGDSAGSGTNTLLVTGDVTAHPRLTNAQAPGDFDTDFTVHVSLNNQAVTTGTVAITSKNSKLNLTYNPSGGGNSGRWEGTVNGYDEVYQLDVTSGPDSLSGVRVDGPDIHVYTAPTAGATMDSTMVNDIKWSRSIVAERCTFRVNDGGGGAADGLTITDSGDYSIAPGTLKADQTQSRQNTLRVTRTNSVTPSGAVTGSQVSVSIENEIDVVVLPNPAL